MEEIRKELLSEKNIDQLWKSIEQDIDKYESRHRRVGMKKMLRYAAAVLLVAGIAGTAFFLKNKSEDKQKLLADASTTMKYNHFTGKAETTQLTLSDGTKVWLNANTKLYAPSEFKGKKREIKVEGEIYVEAFHDARHPFVVHTNDAQVEVLGTKFSVKAKSESHYNNVILVSGSVAVNEKESGNKTVLVPNQKLEMSGNELTVRNVDAHSMISWTQGVYTYDNESLETILRQLAEYYDVKIQIESNKPNYYTGKMYLNNNFEETLNALSHMQYVDYYYSNNCYYIKIF